MTQPVDWTGRVALVTGASAGIGSAIAHDLATQAGMKVVVTGRRADRLDHLADTLREAGARVLAVTVDLRDEDSILAMFETVRGQWGGVDVLVNNAGVGYESGIIDGPTDHFRETLEVNVLALVICTREAIADMRRQNVAGHVVQISSMSAHRVVGPGVYPASKYAVRALTESLRQELRALQSPIRVSSISPGFVESEFHQRYFGSAEAASDRLADQQRLPAADIAEAVRWVISRPAGMQVHDVLIRPTDQVS